MRAKRITRPLILIAASAIAVASCNGSQVQLRSLESSGALRVEPAPAGAADHDYVVSLRNVKDIGYDLDTKESRDLTASQAVAAQCAAPKIVGEKTIETGTYLLGNASRTYVIRIKC